MASVFAILASIGLANILKYGSILSCLRNILFKIKFFKELFSCSMCLGFWSGVAICLLYVYVFGYENYHLLLPLVTSCCFQFFDSIIDVIDRVYIYLKNRENTQN